MDDVLKLDFLGSLQRSGILPGLDRMHALMTAFGDPQLQYPVILVTGTNGKGSTTCFIESILRAAGYRTGRFTSPHLVDVRERISLDGRMIDPDLFLELGGELRRAMETHDIRATFFEALSAIGFLAFRKTAVDVAVVEIGMGGRFDSTNVAEPVVSVLTNVGLEHVGFLGHTREEIAREKVGIARDGRPFVTAVDDGLYASTVGPALAAIGARPVRFGVDFRCQPCPEGLDWAGWRSRHDGLVSGLPGAYQRQNLCLAVAAVESLCETAGFRVGDDAFRDGARSAYWPARLQKVASDPTIIVDGCHNVHGALSLRGDLEGLARPLILVHGTRPEKDYDGVLSLLAPMADGIIETAFDGGAAPETVADVARRHVRSGVAVDVIPSIADAVAHALAMAGSCGTVVVVGSLYMAGAAIRTMGWKI